MDRQITKVLWFIHQTEHTHSIIAMRKVVGVVLYQCSEAAATESRHVFCEDSNWCKMRKAEMLGIPYSDKPGLRQLCAG